MLAMYTFRGIGFPLTVNKVLPAQNSSAGLPRLVLERPDEDTMRLCSWPLTIVSY